MVGPFLERLLECGRASLGELTLVREGGSILVFGPGSGPGAPEAPADPEAFRAWIRATGDGHYRPLSGARSLRRNWVRTCPDVASAAEALDVIYPLALLHAARWAEGRLEPVPWPEVVGRQRGMYATAGGLGPEGTAMAREILCSTCVRCPVWAGALPGGEAAIPCPEPCGMLLALCRAAAGWENDPPPPVEPDPGVRFAEFETPGNVLREAYLRRAAG